MIALAFTGYWPSLEDINRRQHETPTQELKLRPKTMPEPAPTAPVIANPRPNVKRRKIKQRVMFKRINHVEIVTDQPDRVYQMTRRCALAAVGAGFVAISISTYGADLGLDIPPRSPSHRSTRRRVADQQPSARLTLPMPSRIAPCSAPRSSSSSTRS